MRKNNGVKVSMANILLNWIDSVLNSRPNEFELSVLRETASRMSGKNKSNLLKQIDSIKTVQSDPFKTCFSFLFSKSVDTDSVRIDDRPGLILSCVSGNMTGKPLSAEIGLQNGRLLSIVTDRPLSKRDRKENHYEINNVVLYPRLALPSPEWLQLIKDREKFSQYQITILEPKERWLHPWFAAWYLCFADICSQYYILQKCDAKGDLILFDYINDEISRTGGTPQELFSYAAAHGDWVEDKDAIRQLLQKSYNEPLSIKSY